MRSRLSRYMRGTRPVRRGFTLVELLVVIAIIGILIGMLMPAIQMARESARRANCSSNMKNVATAIQLYSTQNQEQIPVGIYKTTRVPAFAAILPQLELQNFAKAYGNYSGNAWSYTTVINQRIPIFICPSDNPSGTVAISGGNFARSNFVLCFGSNTVGTSATPTAAETLAMGVFRVGSTSSFATMATDGASNTVMVSETVAGKTSADVAGAWGYGGPNSSAYTHLNPPVNTAPNTYVAGADPDLAAAVGGASSMHPGLVNVFWADIHGTNVATGIDQTAWKAMGTVNGGEAFAAGGAGQ